MKNWLFKILFNIISLVTFSVVLSYAAFNYFDSAVISVVTGLVAAILSVKLLGWGKADRVRREIIDRFLAEEYDSIPKRKFYENIDDVRLSIVYLDDIAIPSQYAITHENIYLYFPCYRKTGTIIIPIKLIEILNELDTSKGKYSEIKIMGNKIKLSLPYSEEQRKYLEAS